MRAAYEIRDADSTSALLVMVIGAAFAVVGLVDLTLMWTPVRFGNPAWEFATLSRTFTNVPLTGLGLLLVAFGLVRLPEWGGFWVRIAAGVIGLATVVLLAMGVLYVTVVPVVIRETPVEGLDAVGSTVVKNGVEIVVYTIAFALATLLLWRGVEKVA